MKQGILIFGPSGAGKTTLGQAVAGRLGLPYVDIDEHIWRQDTPLPCPVLRLDGRGGLGENASLIERAYREICGR